MFEFNPNLIQEEDDDDDEGETVYYTRKQEVSYFPRPLLVLIFSILYRMIAMMMIVVP